MTQHIHRDLKIHKVDLMVTENEIVPRFRERVSILSRMNTLRIEDPF
jgi:hypothetical protein